MALLQKLSKRLLLTLFSAFVILVFLTLIDNLDRFGVLFRAVVEPSALPVDSRTLSAVKPPPVHNVSNILTKRKRPDLNIKYNPGHIRPDLKRLQTASDREIRDSYRKEAERKYDLGTENCDKTICRDGVCFENLKCVGKAVQKSYLRNFKNPCFHEKVLQDVNSDQNITRNLIIRRMIPDTKNPAIQNLQLQWNRHRTGSHQLRCLPYFFIIGMEKCATTDLYKRIGHHPDIVLSPAKELQWWTRRRFFILENNTFPKLHQADEYKITHKHSLINVPISHYYAFFDKASENIEFNIDGEKKVRASRKLFHPQVTGDGSPNIMYWNDFSSVYDNITSQEGPKSIVAQHIHSVLPKAKIIAILRNPVDRLYSSYLFFNRFVSKEDFHMKVEEAISYFKNCIDKNSLRFCVYDTRLKAQVGSTTNLMQGIYIAFLQDWYQTFPQQQIHIMHTESYKGNELSEVNEVFKFLELKPVSANDSVGQMILKQEKAFKGQRYRLTGAMFESTRELLHSFYAPYNQQLATFLNDTRFLWPELKKTADLPVKP